MAWTEAARKAALEARRRKGKAPKMGSKTSLRRGVMARSMLETRRAMRSAGFKVLGLKGYSPNTTMSRNITSPAPAVGNQAMRSTGAAQNRVPKPKKFLSGPDLYDRSRFLKKTKEATALRKKRTRRPRSGWPRSSD